MALLPNTTLYPSESLLPASGPNALTGGAIVYAGAAILLGSVNPNGFDTTYHFEYGTTIAYGTSAASSSVGSGTAWVEVNDAVLGLSLGTYHYRVVAVSSDGTDYGADATFTVTADRPALHGFVHAAGRGQ